VDVFTVEEGTALSTAVQVAALTAEKAEVSWDRLRLILRDPLLKLDVPSITETFAGTNSGATGYEGTADDIKGQFKPFVYGKAEMVPPVLVNSSTLVFIANFDKDGNPAPVNVIDDVRLDGNDAGVTLDDDYATLADLVAASIPSGQYGTCLAKGALRFNNLTNDNIVTCRVTVGATTADRTTGQIVNRLLQDRAGIASGDILGVSALDTAQGAEFGIYIDSDLAVAEVVDMVLAGAGGYIVPTELNKFQLGRLEAPSGTAARVFEEWELIREGAALEMIPSGDYDNGLLTWKVIHGANKYYRVFNDTEFAAAVSDSEKARMKTEYRNSVAEDATILTAELGAEILEYNSMMQDLSAAATEATRQLNLRKVDRDRWRLRVKDSALLNLGSIIEINTTRFGFAGSKKFVITGYRFNFYNNFVDYFLWG
jgi:hypothetical protein